MSLYPWEEGALTLAIDPAQLVTAIAWMGRSPDGGIVRGVTSIGDILEAGKITRLLESLGDTVKFDRVVLGVEYPRWNAGASQTVRSAANTYIRLVKKVYPKVRVRKIDPNEWQALFGFRARAKGVSTKDHSMWIATRAYGWKIDGIHDRADAALILEYLRQNHPKPQPKKKKPQPDKNGTDKV